MSEAHNTNTVYIITGASRGLGRALVQAYLGRDNSTVIAAVRNPDGKDAQSLLSFARSSSSQLIIVKIDSSDPKSAHSAVEELKTKHNITAINVAIANAGISDDGHPIARLPLDVLKEHIEVNGYGPLTFFQAVFPLLEKAGPGAKFIGVGSALGSIGGMEMRPYSMSAYGISKAVLHYIVRKIHFENENIVAVVLEPGFVQTDMGNTGAKKVGLEKAFLTVEESVAGLIREIDAASRETTSGGFRFITEESLPW